MSQFVNYTVELILNDDSDTKLQGIIKKIVDKNIVISNVTYLSGNSDLKSSDSNGNTNGNDNSNITINGSKIKDLKVISLPPVSNKKKNKSSKDTKNNNNNNNNNNEAKKKDKSKKKLDSFEDTDIDNYDNNENEYDFVKQTQQFQNQYHNNNGGGNGNSNGYSNNNNDYRSKDIDWDTDNISKIKSSQEFDFASNLQKFDKLSVFKELSENDKIDPSHRLVSHNKLPQKTKYDNDEMIINKKKDTWDDITTNSTTNITTPTNGKSVNNSNNGIQFTAAPGSAISTANATRNTTPDLLDILQKRLPFKSSASPYPLDVSTRGDDVDDGHDHHDDHDDDDDDDDDDEDEFSDAYEPNNHKAIPPPVPPVVRRNTSITLSSLNTYSFKSLNENEIIPTCSPIQLLEIENTSIKTFGSSELIFSENAGRNISELIINIFGGNSSNRISNSNHNSPPLMLILAGNNRSGARAIATGRHLFNHGIRVITFLLYSKDYSDDDLSPIVTQQLTSFESIGGKVCNTMKELKELLSKIDSPLEFILDGLQSFDNNLSDLIGQELSLAISLVNWCNSSNVNMMSIDLPSGLDPGSGQSNDTGPSAIPYLYSKWIVSLGLPISALTNSYKMGVVSKNDWIHYLIDISIPKKVYGTKGSFRKFDRLWFTNNYSTVLEIIES
ncbi:unnamed protein product [[Candida] boidinii]|uniref:Enhancer of mRNA-decapping protein 3 n=1 Tax=Candida boidinii TaxID=5477 RepID=A0A9W6W8X1_CANBO|nr:hypothetical protein B5S30_g3311 [[Candida] boidinii]GME68890.1 unnamed protein product [[Candida] boidinii]